MSAQPPRVTSQSYVGALQNLGFDFKLNSVTELIEVNSKPLSDILESVLFSKLRDRGFKSMAAARDAIISHAYQNSYHPIRDYLNSLAYDGGSHIEQLASYFDDDGSGLFFKLLRRWLIGAVRRVFESGSQNRMLVLDGPQGCGKSKFCEWLIPDHLKSLYFKAGSIDPDNKDHRIDLTQRWIWEAAELGNITRKADREALKNFLSLERVTERKAYHRYSTQKPAMASFIGTINSEGGFLSDPTGSRRFMICRLSAIDWKGYTAALHPDQIWSEAVSLFYSGESADLAPDELNEVQQANDVIDRASIYQA